MQGLPLRAFIGRAKGHEAGVVRQFLENEGVFVDDPVARVVLGDPPTAALLDAARACDLAVIIYAPDSPNLGYELGVLDALEKPVLVVASSSDELPAQYLRYLNVRSTPTGTNDLHDVVKRFVSEVRESKQGPLPAQRRSSTKPRAPRQQRDKTIPAAFLPSAEILRHWSAYDVERTTKLLFEWAGGFVEAHNLPGEHAADLVLWSAAPSEVLPHPLLVQVKAGKLSANSLHDAELRLQRAVQRSGAIGGLLVYQTSTGERLSNVPATPGVTRVAFEELVEVISKRTLNGALRALMSDEASSADA